MLWHTDKSLWESIQHNLHRGQALDMTSRINNYLVLNTKETKSVQNKRKLSSKWHDTVVSNAKKQTKY